MMTMEIPQWAGDHWIGLYFGFDLILFLLAVVLWNPGMRSYAGLILVCALLLSMAFLTVLFTNLLLEDDSAQDQRAKG
jgi:hypothetical protein